MDKQMQIKVAQALEPGARQLAGHPLFEMGRNAKCTQVAILTAVVMAALYNISINMQVAENQIGGVCADTIFNQLNQNLTVDAIELMMKGVIRRAALLLRRRFGGRRFAVAMDYTDEMYYGNVKHDLVVGTKPKDGSSHAHKYFTVSIVTEGGRFFLFSYPVESRSISHVFFINRALEFLKEIEIRPHVLLLDREFNSVDVMAMLQDEGYRFVTPVDHDGKFERKTDEVKGFPAIFNGWQVTNSDKETVQVDLVVLEKLDREKKRVLHGYFTNLPKDYYEKDPGMLAKLYSRRWGIETSHRVEDRFRVYTTCLSGIVRYLFFVIGVLLYNLWVELNLNLCEKVKNFKIQVPAWPMVQCLIRLLGAQPV